MNTYKTRFLFILLFILNSCGKNETQENIKKARTNIRVAVPIQSADLAADSVLKSNLEDSFTSISKKNTISKKIKKATKKDSLTEKNLTSKATTLKKEPVNSPLRNLLNRAQIGKSYTKKELIEEFKFPKEAVDLVKHVTCVGHNKLYFKWGNTWVAEKVSDAKFKNDTLLFTFKQNKTYVSGGAIGIKYNKKIHTYLILNNGAAYIPSVKGYHWQIGK